VQEAARIDAEKQKRGSVRVEITTDGELPADQAAKVGSYPASLHVRSYERAATNPIARRPRRRCPTPLRPTSSASCRYRLYEGARRSTG
jgi:hypothetical protein